MAKSPTVVVFDYGFGNVRSCENSLRAAGAAATVTNDLTQAHDCDGLVVPGVGAYAACMQGLLDAGGVEVVRQRLAHGQAVLGICVGMQVMFAHGVEHGHDTPGVGVWPGVVDHLSAPVLPHMGWNVVDAPADSRLFAGVAAQRFYFVHSYAAKGPISTGAETGVIETYAKHGERFLAAVEDGPLWATQFHPEKSGHAGVQLLANWVSGLS